MNAAPLASTAPEAPSAADAPRSVAAAYLTLADGDAAVALRLAADDVGTLALRLAQAHQDIGAGYVRRAPRSRLRGE